MKNNCLLCAMFFAFVVASMAYADVPAIQWNVLPERPIAVGGQYAGVSGGALLAAGGAHFPTPLFEGGSKVWVDSVFALKPNASQWIEAGKLPRPLAYGGSVSDDKGLIVVGGGDAERHYADVFRLRWNGEKLLRYELPSLPKASAFHTAAMVGSKIYATGGQAIPGASEAIHALWRLDLERVEDGWRAVRPWPGLARILPVLAVCEGSLYLFGGCEVYGDENGETKRRYLTDAYRYNEKDGWERLLDLPRAATGAPTPAWTLGDRIAIFSGDDGEYADRVQELKDRHPGFDRDALILDLKQMQWSRVGRVPFSLATTAAVMWRGAYVIPGGEDRPGHRIPTVFQGVRR